MRKVKLLFLVLVTLGLGACGGTMMKAPTQQIKPPSSGKATIVFMRTSFVAGAIGVEMLETTKGDLKFVGNLAMGDKIAYETTPGKKEFMAYGIAADFMLANVESGKTYYVIVRPNWGTGGFAPTPVRHSTSKYNMAMPEFKEWVSDTDLVIPGPDTATWFAEKKPELEEVYKEYWARFQTKTPEQIAERTLNPEDGVPK